MTVILFWKQLNLGVPELTSSDVNWEAAGKKCATFMLNSTVDD